MRNADPIPSKKRLIIICEDYCYSVLLNSVIIVKIYIFKLILTASSIRKFADGRSNSGGETSALALRRDHT